MVIGRTFLQDFGGGRVVTDMWGMVTAGMLSSGEIGFMTAVAASGCVMLLVLGRQKLSETKISQKSSVKQRENDGNYLPRCSRSCLASSSHGARKGPNALKKVRFAEDVVEPSGDNERYRRRHTLAMMTRLRQPPEENAADCSSNRRQPARTVNSAGKCMRMDAVNASGEISGARKTPAYPNIPANRLALYKGILQYRSQTAASTH